MAGLARDGGLYVPESWPQLRPRDIAALAGQPYAQGRGFGDAALGGRLRFRQPNSPN